MGFAQSHFPLLGLYPRINCQTNLMYGYSCYKKFNICPMIRGIAYPLKNYNGVISIVYESFINFIKEFSY